MVYDIPLRDNLSFGSKPFINTPIYIYVYNQKNIISFGNDNVATNVVCSE